MCNENPTEYTWLPETARMEPHRKQRGLWSVYIEGANEEEGGCTMEVSWGRALHLWEAQEMLAATMSKYHSPLAEEEQ